MIQQKLLDSRALDYIREYLKLGRTLSSLLLNLNLESGEILTYLPSDISAELAYHFNEGGIYPESSEIIDLGNGYLAKPVINPSKPIVINLIEQFLVKQTNSLVLFEDSLQERKDYDNKLVSDHRLLIPRIFYENEVYFYLSPKQSNNQAVKEVFNDARSYCSIVILISLPKPANFNFTDLEETVTLQNLELLTKSTQKFIIRAFDGEGYIIWSQIMQ